MGKIARIVAIFMAAFFALFATAQSASATTGGVVINQTSSTGNVRVSSTNPFDSHYSDLVYPGENSAFNTTVKNVQCFYPTKTAYSQWGGRYDALVIRCMSSSNITLYLKVG